MISIITRTYNRADLIERAIRSILVQDYTDFEIIVVNDASTDNTLEVLSRINDYRIRIVNHSRNLGMAGAFHTGLNCIKGEWFTLLDSDDEMVPEALSTMLGVLDKINPQIDAITCNCIDTTTGEFSGKGLYEDQYLDAKTILQKCSGEFWGLTKTSLLPERANEQYLAAVWNKINKKATRYYIHKGLRKYYTDGNDRYSLPSVHLSEDKKHRKYFTYISILNEKELIEDYRTNGKKLFLDLHYSMGVFFIQYGDKKLAKHCIKEIASMPNSKIKTLILIFGFIFGKNSIFYLKKIKRSIFKQYILK